MARAGPRGGAMPRRVAARRRGSAAAPPGRRQSSAAVVSVAIVAGDHDELALRQRRSRRRGSARRPAAPCPPAARSLIVWIEPLDDGRRETLGRLVHDQQLRVGQQRPADREHLLLAARQRRAADVLALGQPREQLVDALGVHAAFADAPTISQVLVDRQRLEQPPALRDEADAGLGDPVRAACRSARRRRAAPSRRLRREQPDDRGAQRRLAHAVAADQRDRLGAHA